MQKKILVIGNAGYVGSVITQELLKSGFEVIGFDLLWHGESNLEIFLKYPNFTSIKGDIRNISELEEPIKSSDINTNVEDSNTKADLVAPPAQRGQQYIPQSNNNLVAPPAQRGQQFIP